MAASFLIVIAISSVVLYNTVEAFRLSVVDYAIELFDIGEGSIVSVEANEEKSSEEVVPTWLPEGYEVELDKNEVGIRMINYSNGQYEIVFTAHSDISMGSYTIDTENADKTYNIKILDYDGVVVEKGSELYVYWFEPNTAYCLWTDLMEPETIVHIAKSCYY